MGVEGYDRNLVALGFDLQKLLRPLYQQQASLFLAGNVGLKHHRLFASCFIHLSLSGGS